MRYVHMILLGILAGQGCVSKAMVTKDLEGFIKTVAVSMARGMSDEDISGFCTLAGKKGEVEGEIGYVTVKLSNAFTAKLGGEVGISIAGQGGSLSATGENKETASLEFTLAIDMKKRNRVNWPVF